MAVLTALARHQHTYHLSVAIATYERHWLARHDDRAKRCHVAHQSVHTVDALAHGSCHDDARRAAPLWPTCTSWRDAYARRVHFICFNFVYIIYRLLQSYSLFVFFFKILKFKQKKMISIFWCFFEKMLQFFSQTTRSE